MKNGGPAFPEPVAVGGSLGSSRQHSVPGMTLRDYFAGQAIAGILANPEQRCTTYPDDYCKEAYIVADAMLKEREK